MRNMIYEDRLKILLLSSLAHMRLRGDLIEAFIFKNQLHVVNSDTVIALEKESRARGNSQKLKKQRFKALSLPVRDCKLFSYEGSTQLLKKLRKFSTGFLRPKKV